MSKTVVAGLDLEIEDRQRGLQTLTDRKAQLLAAMENKPEARHSSLRSFSQSVERAVVAALHPLSLYFRTLAETGTDTSKGDAPPDNRSLSGAVSAMASDSRVYVNTVLPMMVILTLLLVRNKYSRFYQQRRSYLQALAVAAALFFPLSAFAQSPETAPTAEAPLPFADLLLQADELLALNREQRYIRQLTADAMQGRRILLSDVDLSSSPLPAFSSVVVGSGESHTTLAALFLTQDDKQAAVEQLRLLALPETRYATKDNDPESFESLITRTARYLADNDEAFLAKQIIEQHLDSFRDSGTAEALFPALLDRTETRSDVAISSAVIEAAAFDTNDAEPSSSYVIGGENPEGVPARASADEPLGTTLLRDMIDTGIARSDVTLIQQAIESSRVYIGDVGSVFELAQQLREAGWQAAASQLLQGAIDKASASDTVMLNGQAESKTDALKYLSYESFRRGYLDEAEEALMAALKPLSSAERRAMLIRVPPELVDASRVPEPDKLVAPLYLGLLHEKQGRPDAARARFEAENRLLVENLIASDGLFVPDMINHLTLLASVLDEQTETAELARIDKVLTRLEQERIAEREALDAPLVEERQSTLDQLNEERAALQAELQALESEMLAAEKAAQGSTLSAFVLLLRNLGLIAVLSLYGVGALVIALQHALAKSAQRTSAFWWKFLETLGWIWALSVFSLPLGLAAIVTAQFFLVNQGRSSNALANQVEDIAREEKDTAVFDPNEAQQRQDSRWNNVIEMLRDSKNIEAG